MITQKNASPARKLEMEAELGYYVKVSKAVLYAGKRISHPAKTLYSIIRDYQGNNQYAWPSVETLAANMECSTRQVSRLLTELEQVNAIEIIATPGHSNLYRVLYPEIAHANTNNSRQQEQPPATAPTHTTTTTQPDSSTLPHDQTADSNTNAGNVRFQTADAIKAGEQEQDATTTAARNNPPNTSPNLQATTPGNGLIMSGGSGSSRKQEQEQEAGTRAGNVYGNARFQQHQQSINETTTRADQEPGEDEEAARTAQRHANIMAILDARLLPDEAAPTAAPTKPAAEPTLLTPDKSVVPPMTNMSSELDESNYKTNVCEKRASRTHTSYITRQEQAAKGQSERNGNAVYATAYKDWTIRDKSPNSNSNQALTPEQAEIAAKLEAEHVAQPIAAKIAAKLDTKKADALITASRDSSIHNPAGYLVYMATCNATPTSRAATATDTKSQPRRQYQPKPRQTNNQEAGAMAYIRRNAARFANDTPTAPNDYSNDEATTAAPAAAPRARVWIKDGSVIRPAKAWERYDPSQVVTSPY